MTVPINNGIPNTSRVIQVVTKFIFRMYLTDDRCLSVPTLYIGFSIVLKSMVLTFYRDKIMDCYNLYSLNVTSVTRIDYCDDECTSYFILNILS